MLIRMSACGVLPAAGLEALAKVVPGGTVETLAHFGASGLLSGWELVLLPQHMFERSMGESVLQQSSD